MNAVCAGSIQIKIKSAFIRVHPRLKIFLSISNSGDTDFFYFLLFTFYFPKFTFEI